MTHLSEKSRLRDVSSFRAPASFVGDCFCLFEFPDQRVFFRARF
jgi:hypothetical protein